MLRAITGYFFGGMTQDVPPVAEECETREVKDWLVVNMPNRPIDDVELDDAVNLDESELEMKWLLESHIEEECANSSSDANPSNENESFSLSMHFPTTNDKCSDSIDELLIIDDLSMFLEPNPVSISYKHYMVNSPNDIVLDFQEIFGDTETLNKLIRKRTWAEIDEEWKDLNAEMNEEMNAITKDQGSSRARRVLERAGILMPGASINNIKQLPPLLSQKQIKRIVAKSPAVTCHPVYSPTYVNHRNPALPPKTDLLQRIKELEPEQQATLRALKTHMTRGQLNRQNKNYIYDTSTKKNRRKNLQRNHSGANNNRKC